MPQYLFVYHGGTMPETPEEGAKSMAAWQAWMSDFAEALVDGGAPVGKSTTVTADGSVVENGGANPASGYSLVEADDHEAAQKIARDCPHLKAGGSIEIAQTIEM